MRRLHVAAVMVSIGALSFPVHAEIGTLAITDPRHPATISSRSGLDPDARARSATNAFARCVVERKGVAATALIEPTPSEDAFEQAAGRLIVRGDDMNGTARAAMLA